MSDLHLRKLDGTATSTILTELADAYMAAYEDDPDIGRSIYARESFIERTHNQTQSPGFVLICAYDATRIAGFSFGLPFPAGRWWRGEAETDPPVDLLHCDKFAVIELVILPEFRGRGLATRLMRSILESRKEDYAILLADQDGHARAVYDRWGWRPVQRLRPASDVPALDVLALKLDAGPHSGRSTQVSG